MSILFQTIQSLQFLLRTKKISVQELHKETIKNIEIYNPNLNAIIETYGDQSFISSSSPLSGIPFIHKDNMLIKGKVASAGSKILTNHIAPYTATVIERLIKQGAYSVGRANCDEFAMGSSGETSFYGPTKNPWNREYVPGGSSSGSAAVVAAGLVPFSFGTETGGSVRQPAVLCGISGLKTTYGLHSRYGIIAYASSLDQVGIFAHTAEDIATVLSTSAGHDSFDPTTTNRFNTYNYSENINSSIRGKKIGIIKNAIEAHGVTKETQKNLEEAVKVFQRLGCEIKYISLPTMEYSAALYFIISRAEAASNLSRFDGVKYGYRTENYNDLQSMYQNTRAEGFGYTVQRRIILGNYVLAAEYADEYYNKAKKIQKMMKAEFEQALDEVDVLFCPVTPEPAFKLNQMINNPLAIDLQDYFTASANLVGIPALALPSGMIHNLPIGFQLIGNYFSEELLLQLGHAYQKETQWHTLNPQL
jgi:aspartyl-tRNA(Asn)/glutamyl-tRNA(Gln) amidotransferase subunit A